MALNGIILKTNFERPKISNVNIRDLRRLERGTLNLFSNSFIEAFSLKVSDSFVIVKQSARLRDCLEHEFKHTLKDDYTLI